MPERIIAATDGSCEPNPGPCAWAYVIADADGQPARTAAGALGHGSNQVAELAAVLAVLEDTTGPLTVYADSSYAIKCLTTWLPNWRRNGWLNSSKNPVSNRHLIERAAELMEGRDVRLEWVRGHNGHPLNEAADRAAKAALHLPVERPFPTPATVGANAAPTPARARCTATTKSGGRCATDAGPSGLCHVHDPALQCGRPTRRGKPCTMPTGGGPCRTHTGPAPTPGQTSLLPDLTVPDLTVPDPAVEAEPAANPAPKQKPTPAPPDSGPVTETGFASAPAPAAKPAPTPEAARRPTPTPAPTPERKPPVPAPRAAGWPPERGRTGTCADCGDLVQQYPVAARWVVLDAAVTGPEAVPSDERWYVDVDGCAHRADPPAAEPVRTRHVDTCPRRPEGPAPWAAALRTVRAAWAYRNSAAAYGSQSQTN